MEIPKLDPVQGARHRDGLEGEWLSLEDLAQLEPFRQIKKAKLNTNLRLAPGASAPAVKAAVRRRYQAGEVICRAGDYGSTAFLLLEGKATAESPASATPARVPGRDRSSLGRLARLFQRRTRRPHDMPPSEVELGEASRYGHWERRRPAPPMEIRPGDFFGVDTCVNFYPREATVRAVEPCVVVEMLRSVLDTARESAAGDRIDEAYAAAAVRSELRRSPLLEHLPADELDVIAAASTLLNNDSDDIADDVIYREGDSADGLYLVRSGTIKLSHNRDGRETIFSYLGRGAVFGVENMRPHRAASTLTLRCLSHPADFPAIEIGGTVTLGRKSSCTVRFPASRPEVGRLHCRFEDRNGDVYLIDNDSVNFTLLNGEQIREAIVAPGDVVAIVDFVFELVRTPVTEAGLESPKRLATAGALDNFEVVRIPAAVVQRLTREDAEATRVFAAPAAQSPSRAEAATPHSPSHQRDLIELNLYNSQNTLLIDLDRCTRCDECVRACASAHDGVARFTRDGPRFGKYLVTLACRSCTDPKCMIGCPVGSIFRKDSLEIHIEDWCIGCQRCANQCPFGNINMVQLAGEAADAAPMLRATVCDLCAGYDGPNCVYACPHDAAIRVNPSAFLSPQDR